MDGGSGLGVLGCNNTPLDQDLILKLILEHVGRADVDDLLTCRLVKHSWNRAAVQILEQQHGYALALNYKKLLKLKSLLWRTKLSKIAAEQQELASLRLSLKFQIVKEEKELDIDSASEETEDEDDDAKSAKCNTVSEAAEVSQVLIAHPWLRVAFINCTVNDDEEAESEYKLTNHVLFNLLKLTSKDLTSFTLNAYDVSEHFFEEFNFDGYFKMSFPRLTTIQYGFTFNSEFSDDEHGLADLSTHVLNVIQGAQNLAKLSLEIRYACHDTWVQPGNCLQRLIFECSANLQQLDLHFDEEDGESVLQRLSDMKFPKLTSLSLKNLASGKCKLIKEFNHFMEHHCPVLTRFEMNFVWSEDGVDELIDEGEDLDMKFPVLPKILHFGFFPNYADTPNHLQDVFETFTQMMAKFPSVRTLSLDFGVLLMLGARFKRSGQLLPANCEDFLTVSTLEVVIPFVEDNYKLLDLTYTHMGFIYRRMFPILDNLIIKPEMKKITNGSKIELKRAIKFLCMETECLLESLEIQNYARAWLPKIAKDDAFFFCKLTNLKSLKLFPPKNMGEYPELNPSELLAKLPFLQVFQFGKQRVGEAEIYALRQSIKKLEWLKHPISKFKNSEVL